MKEKPMEQFSSPDQIHQYIQITNPGVWSLLIAFLAMVIAVIIWFVVGVIPSTLEIKGIMFPGDGTVAVKAPYDGTISDMRVATGDAVVSYQVLAVILKQKLTENINKEGEKDRANKKNWKTSSFATGLIQ